MRIRDEFVEEIKKAMEKVAKRQKQLEEKGVKKDLKDEQKEGRKGTHKKKKYIPNEVLDTCDKIGIKFRDFLRWAYVEMLLRITRIKE